jgi:hypothetical protein
LLDGLTDKGPKKRVLLILLITLLRSQIPQVGSGFFVSVEKYKKQGQSKISQFSVGKVHGQDVSLRHIRQQFVHNKRGGYLY